MELRHLYGSSTGAAQLVVLFCTIWPIVAFTFLHRRERSSAPVTGMLLPMFVALCGAWFDIAHALGPFGASHSSIAVERGIVEALMEILFGVRCGGCVGVVALIKRHRPLLDRGSAVLAALLVAGVAAASTVPYTIPLARAAAVATGLLALATFLWLFLVVRRRVVSRAVPFGIPVFAVAMLAMIVTTWLHLRAIFLAGMN